ncbi:augmenter of liver regeneration [Cryphonectria parasitica EP155]|uniref:Sulfhydryl oxidase n=1 Tax=Cryphonectria parasitica (strain ATCC 38755 / EP155) TaxID=660469 RepID=A0A9P5CMZ0_CRYP1|nr:augmenter of liver regeneration [Cryphonectria parasitica EP155]KAF3763757.1 augmenter of liver regeneration [Cryphonectria parasitica EP155]
MAEDSRGTQSDTTLATVGLNGGEQSKPLPPGMVLGPDGKPCRSCTSKSAFSAWAAQAKTMKAPQTTAAATTASTMPPVTETDDCPADVETLGRHSWTLLHSIAATYPTSPSPAQQDDVVGFVKLFSRLYPCWVCAEDFQKYIRKDPVRAGSRGEFGKWLCDAHNDVNKKLGKPVFDCSRWEERWRTGWKDRRCD